MLRSLKASIYQNRSSNHSIHIQEEQTAKILDPRRNDIHLIMLHRHQHVTGQVDYNVPLGDHKEEIYLTKAELVLYVARRASQIEATWNRYPQTSYLYVFRFRV